MHADWNREANKIMYLMQQADEVLYLVTLSSFNKTKSLSKLPPKINDVLEAAMILQNRDESRSSIKECYNMSPVVKFNCWE